jgi:hypothetical protein
MKAMVEEYVWLTKAQLWSHSGLTFTYSMSVSYRIDKALHLTVKVDHNECSFSLNLTHIL